MLCYLLQSPCNESLEGGLCFHTAVTIREQLKNKCLNSFDLSHNSYLAGWDKDCFNRFWTLLDPPRNARSRSMQRLILSLKEDRFTEAPLL